MPGAAYPGAVHQPSDMPAPHRHAAEGRERGGYAHVDAGPLLRTTLILIQGPGGPRAGAAAAPAYQVEVCPTPYGNIVHLVVPPVI